MPVVSSSKGSLPPAAVVSFMMSFTPQSPCFLGNLSNKDRWTFPDRANLGHLPFNKSLAYEL
ncbi:MAG TPA: hypothetical protein VFD73_17965, partial [Gemmatimonadales bacterium]|nr:hypothetical protein [Gemmatimonadales bacterium]